MPAWQQQSGVEDRLPTVERRQDSWEQALIIHLAGSHISTWRYLGHWVTMDVRSSVTSGSFNLHFQATRILLPLLSSTLLDLHHLSHHTLNLFHFTEMEEMDGPGGTQAQSCQSLPLFNWYFPSLPKKVTHYHLQVFLGKL